MSKLSLSGFCAAAALAVAAFFPTPAHAAPLYTLTKTVPLGGGVAWDYLHFDAPSDRLFISHGNELTVLSGRTGAVIGEMTGLDGSHGVAIDHATGLGYADSSGSKTTSIFNLQTLKIVKTIPALLDADGMVFDPSSNQVFVVGGDANAVRSIDAKTNEPGALIALGGGPEFLVIDGQGGLYINLKTTNQMVKVDTRTDQVVARWPVPCDAPTGLALDTATNRLFSSCRNGHIAVLNAETGAIVADLPIDLGTDSAAFDPSRKLVFSANRDGTLSVIREDDADHFTVLPPVHTELGARTMAVDPATGRIFEVTATVKSVLPPPHAGWAHNYTFVPHTFRELLFDPAPAD
jgi:DNA-binding beta-propeller fold protein YncE